MTKDGIQVYGCGRGNHSNRANGCSGVSLLLPRERPQFYPLAHFYRGGVKFTKTPKDILAEYEKDNLLALIQQQLPCRMWRVKRCFERIEKFVIECKKERPITKGEQKVIDIWVSECNEEVNEIGRLLCDKQVSAAAVKKKIIIKLSKEENTRRKHRIEDDEPLNLVAERIRATKAEAFVDDWYKKGCPLKFDKEAMLKKIMLMRK